MKLFKKIASWFNVDSSFYALCFVFFVILLAMLLRVEFIILIQ